MVLFINSCVREDSRTERVAEKLLSKLGEYTELRLSEEDIRPLDRKLLQNRIALTEKGDYSSDIFRYAKQFAAADTIVIAAPFWDMSFPSKLKVYIENIYVTGLVSRFSEKGIPEGLCKAEKLYYVTTSGGKFIPEYSYDYIKRLAKEAFGIPETELIKAEMLDVYGFDPEKIISDLLREIDSKF